MNPDLMPEIMKRHIILAQGGQSVGIISADSSPQGPDGLKASLNQLGLQFQEVLGQFGTPERVFLVFNPTREQMFELGRQYSQEAIIFGKNGRHELIFTNGDNQGKFHPSDVRMEFFKDRPHDYFIEVPQMGYIRFYFDGDKLLDSPLSTIVPAQAVAPNGQAQPDLNKSEHRHLVGGIHKVYHIVPHPHAYPWHDGHTSHHPNVKGHGVVVYRLGQKATLSNVTRSEAKLNKSEPIQENHYDKIASTFGSVTKGSPSELSTYSYHGKLPEIERLVNDHGFKPYSAGNKHGKPDLANKNYNTSHLMIHEPTSGDPAHDEHSKGWRYLHELASALIQPELSKIYGEGGRTGKLGVHRTLNEAKRAVHGEWLATHKQRELSKQLGIHIPEEKFNQELNTIMSESVHRAVSGKVTEPSQAGFRPYSHKLPLETALGLIQEHGRNLGLQGHTDKLRKGEYTVAKEFTPREALFELSKSLKELKELAESHKIQFEALQQRELAKSQKTKKADDMGGNSGAGGPAGAMGDMAMSDKSNMSGVGAFCKACEKHHPEGRCDKAEPKIMKAEEAADRKDMSGSGPKCKMCHTYHPVGMCKHQKSEDYIDLANASDPKKRIKEVPNKHKGVLPGDKPSKVIETSGGTDLGELSKAEVPMAKPPGGGSPTAPPVSKPMVPKVGGPPGTMKSLADIRKSAMLKTAAVPAVVKGEPELAKAIPGMISTQAQHSAVQANAGIHAGHAGIPAGQGPKITGEAVPMASMHDQMSAVQGAAAIRPSAKPAMPKPAAPVAAKKPGIFGRLAAKLGSN